MPPVRTAPPMMTMNKPLKTERSHEENQERAYIAASRRSDRSLEARIESARRASEIHKKRTGRSLRVTEQDVVNEEMYEEEDDELPSYYRRLFPVVGSMDTSGNARLAAFLNQNQAIRQQFAEAIANSEPNFQGMPKHLSNYRQQPGWPDNHSLPPHMMHARSQSFRQAPYTMPAQRANPISPGAAFSPQDSGKPALQSPQTPASSVSSPTPKQNASMPRQTPANTVFPEPMNSADFPANGLFSAQLPREAAMFLNPEYMNLNFETSKPQTMAPASSDIKPKPLHLSFDGMSQTLAPPDVDSKATGVADSTNNYAWQDPTSAVTEPTFSPSDNFDLDGYSNIDFQPSTQDTWDLFNNGGLPTPGEQDWSQFLNFDDQQDIKSTS